MLIKVIDMSIPVIRILVTVECGVGFHYLAYLDACPLIQGLARCIGSQQIAVAAIGID